MRLYQSVLYAACILSLSACTPSKTNTEAGQTSVFPAVQTETEKETDEPVMIDSLKVQERNVTLWADTSETYEIIVTDEDGQILQQFPCDMEPGRLKLVKGEFLYNPYEDFAVVYVEEVDWDKAAALYCFYWEKKEFREKPVWIPCGEYRFGIGNFGYFEVTTTDGAETETAIYSVRDLNEALKLRTWQYNSNTGSLIIEDCIAETIIFEGMTAFGEDGEPAAMEYYQDIFLSDIPYHSLTEEENSFHYEWPGTDVQYQDREEMLRACGLADAVPFYLYYDVCGRLKLELYLDIESAAGCGICHFYSITPAHSQIDSMTGFCFTDVNKEDWRSIDPYSTTTYDGMDGTDMVEDYEMEVEYTKDGRVNDFHSWGLTDCMSDVPEVQDILKIHLIYREDGSLAHRSYAHNPLLFSTNASVENTFYDESERIVYQRSYITHGTVERYYIYTDESDKPSYSLTLDWGGGKPVFVTYR